MYVALAMNAPMQVSSSNSLISLAMTSSQERFRQSHNWEQELWFRDGIRAAGFYCPDEGDYRTAKFPRLGLKSAFGRQGRAAISCRSRDDPAAAN